MDGAEDLLGTWDVGSNGLSTSLSRMNIGAKTNGTRNRSNSRPQTIPDIGEDDGFPLGGSPRFRNGDRASPSKLSKGRTNGEKMSRSFSSNGSKGAASPYADDPALLHFDDPPYTPESLQHRRISGERKPYIPLKAGLEPTSDGYARALALYDFRATDSADLGFHKGQVVVVLDKVGNGDWWKGRNPDGRQGIFPSNYVEVLEMPSVLKGGVGRGQLKARMARSPFD